MGAGKALKRVLRTLPKKGKGTQKKLDEAFDTIKKRREATQEVEEEAAERSSQRRRLMKALIKAGKHPRLKDSLEHLKRMQKAEPDFKKAVEKKIKKKG